MAWNVILLDEVEAWFTQLAVTEPETAQLVEDAIDMLAEEGPIKGSRHHNMKELRPASAGSSELRILFAFDPQRQAVLLVAGDKSGNWKRSYETNIPIADDRLDQWLAREGEIDGA